MRKEPEKFQTSVSLFNPLSETPSDIERVRDMEETVDHRLPLARKDQIIVKELPDELLVYDVDRHKAYCLNRASGLVWKRCDGETSVREIAQLLEDAFAAPVDDDIVWLALGQLQRFHLLEEGQRTTPVVKVSRRAVVRKYLPAALALPVIMTIVSPTAVQAQSGCASSGMPCGGANPPCCPGLNCDGTCFPA
jgi:hypothetical protein